MQGHIQGHKCHCLPLCQSSRPSVYVELVLESHGLLVTSLASFWAAVLGENIHPKRECPNFQTADK